MQTQVTKEIVGGPALPRKNVRRVPVERRAAGRIISDSRCSASYATQDHWVNAYSHGFFNSIWASICRPAAAEQEAHSHPRRTGLFCTTLLSFALCRALH